MSGVLAEIVTKYERIESDFVQRSEWRMSDLEALRAEDAKCTELTDMWLCDSKQANVAPCLSQSPAKKWIELMDGAPVQEGKAVMADVFKSSHHLVPPLPKENEGVLYPISSPCCGRPRSSRRSARRTPSGAGVRLAPPCRRLPR